MAFKSMPKNDEEQTAAKAAENAIASHKRTQHMARGIDVLTGTIEYVDYQMHTLEGGRTAFVTVRDQHGTTYDVTLAFEWWQADEAAALLDHDQLGTGCLRVSMRGMAHTVGQQPMFRALEAKALQ